MSLARTVRTRLAARKGTRWTLAVATLTAIMIAGAAAPAYADTWAEQDDFENNPATVWGISASADGGGWFSVNSGWAHSGSGYAYLWAKTGDSAVQRRVTINVSPFHTVTFCSARIYLRAVNEPVIASLEIIHPINGTLSQTNVALNPSQGWTPVDASNWNPNLNVVDVRVTLVGYGIVSDLRVDDLTLACQYF